jgi:hypothetical protein
MLLVPKVKMGLALKELTDHPYIRMKNFFPKKRKKILLMCDVSHNR